MKKLITICLVCVLTVASQGVLVSIDENGNGTINGNPLPWGIGASGVDPTPPGPINTLFYTLPFMVVPGDLQVIEPDGTISDVLRFTNIPGTTFSGVYVYSDRDPLANDFDLADSMIPLPWTGGPVIVMPESGFEGGWNGVSYNPGFNDPGAASAAIGPMTYDFTSDVPEPATLSMLGLGVLTLLRRRRV
jgi:hypothetical protein